MQYENPAGPFIINDLWFPATITELEWDLLGWAHYSHAALTEQPGTPDKASRCKQTTPRYDWPGGSNRIVGSNRVRAHAFSTVRVKIASRNKGLNTRN